MDLVRVGCFDLPYQADEFVGFNKRGDVLVSEKDSNTLTLFQHLNHGEYQEVASTTLPDEMDSNCFKEVCEDCVYVQQDTDSVTYKMTHDLKVVSQHHHRGELIGIMPPHQPVYAEEEADGWIVRPAFSDVAYKPPMGEWLGNDLSLCVIENGNIVVSDYNKEVLDEFTNQGKRRNILQFYFFNF